MTDEKRDKIPFLCRTSNHYSSVIQPKSKSLNDDTILLHKIVMAKTHMSKFFFKEIRMKDIINNVS